jgi:hypothetical protein
MQLAYILLLLSIGFFAGMSALVIYRSRQEAKKLEHPNPQLMANRTKNCSD